MGLALPATAVLDEVYDEVYKVVGGQVALAVDESRQGETDLNGDGDAIDALLHIYRSSTGVTTSLGLAGNRVAIGPDLVVFPVSESDQGETDLNGDGDATDQVIHVVTFVDDLSPQDVIQEILDFFDASVADGTLVESGPANSASVRLAALRNMLEAAAHFIQEGQGEGACG